MRLSRMLNRMQTLFRIREIRNRNRKKKWKDARRWHRDAADGDTESQCSSMTGSIDLDPIRLVLSLFVQVTQDL